ncbi:unnamed protein product [Strongylus vulgaris]|uniref:Uncharacterized protein n=1 Tax=Strongylus vulgaris TaxID=40348 RepID=A0A3P7L0S9_STRVU|nr:unnamed protein product [Strongylus vulgaris]
MISSLQAAPKPSHTAENAVKKSPSTKVAPWIAAAAVPPKEKSLKEIQEEEERQLRAEQAEQARLRKEHQESVNLQSSGTWSSASQRLQWNQPPQQPVVTKATTKPAWGGADGNALFVPKAQFFFCLELLFFADHVVTILGRSITTGC